MAGLEETIFGFDADRPLRLISGRESDEQDAHVRRQPDLLEHLFGLQTQARPEALLEAPNEVRECLAHHRKASHLVVRPSARSRARRSCGQLRNPHGKRWRSNGWTADVRLQA